MFAPLVPNAARQRTGKDTPYFVPACALRIIGIKHNRIAQQDRDHCLPPVHPCFDKTAGKRVSGDDHAHADPERGNVPGGPGALFDCGGREVFVPEWTGGNVFAKSSKSR